MGKGAHSAAQVSSTKLLARRTAAWLFEMVPIQLVSSTVAGKFIADAIEREDPWTRETGERIGARTSLIVGACVAIVWFACRDIVPGLSWGKLITGVRVAGSGGTAPASLWRLLLRNLVFAIPFFMVLEGVVALLPFTHGRRLGDLMAGTRIVPRSNNWNPGLQFGDWALLFVSAVLYGGAIFAGAYITEAVFNHFYYG